MAEAEFWPETDFQFAWHSILNECNRLIASAVCCHVFAADLQVEAVRISDMEAVVGVGSRVQTPALQFCLDCAFIPPGDRVCDVVDARWRNPRVRRR